MHLDKAKKRIAKQVKKGFHGYPLVSLEYFGKANVGKAPDSATEVVVSFTEEEGADPQKQSFVSGGDAREDETIQSTLVKIIERADAKTVTEIDGISTLSEI
ncbi:hypothetical protein [Marinobacter sp. SS13-12]|uniref:hypothetical protein n=1 Tax=Marinobacter sp. SS13-12 TaxID=3050451 RepID=UPI0025568218|nr:hypothetical protein [Marinobacter sp. SS13-12]MDK8463450.1 hypothetical protein [Marinobacter sp. SS13-12]